MITSVGTSGSSSAVQSLNDILSCTDKLPLNIVTKTVKLLADRVNHGFRDTPASSTKSKVVTIDDSDDGEAGSTGDKEAKAAEEERDLPKGYETVPTGLRLYRWEVKKVLRGKMFECLPKDIQEKIEARAEERLAVSCYTALM